MSANLGDSLRSLAASPLTAQLTSGKGRRRELAPPPFSMAGDPLRTSDRTQVAVRARSTPLGPTSRREPPAPQEDDELFVWKPPTGEGRQGKTSRRRPPERVSVATSTPLSEDAVVPCEPRVPKRSRKASVTDLTAPQQPKEESFVWRHKVAILTVALLAGFVAYAGFKFDIAAHPDVLVAYSLGTLILGAGACYIFKKEESEGFQEPLTRMQKAGRMLLALVAIAAVGAAVGTITYFANRDLFWDAVHKVEPIIEGAFATDAWKVILTGVAMGAIPVAMLASAVHRKSEDVPFELGDKD